MRRLAAILAVAVLAIQWPLWFGRGGWIKVRDLQHQLDTQRATNADVEARNAALTAELRSLRQGSEAIEEHARVDLHFLRNSEVFFQQVPAGDPGAASAPRR